MADRAAFKVRRGGGVSFLLLLATTCPPGTHSQLLISLLVSRLTLRHALLTPRAHATSSKTSRLARGAR